MSEPDSTVAQDMCAFIDASPSPYHAALTAAQRLLAAGFVELAENEVWPNGPGNYFIQRSGSLIAWRVGDAIDANAGFRLVGAHTDSPNLRIKPNPDMAAEGFAQVGVEIYGGALRNSWLDRDLGISGRLALRSSANASAVETALFRLDEPIFRLPQLAIHLDRGVSEKGLKLNAQQHMSPVWATDTERRFVDWLAAEAKVSADDIMGWDLMLHDLTPSGLLGADQSFIAAPRIDNLASCHSGIEALIAVDDAAEHVPLICLFNHEEVGSVSSSGAGSSMLPQVLERIHLTMGGDRSGLPVALANSVCISADGAHATHPNYGDRHEPNHKIVLNGGPVVKRNNNERYATDAVGTALAVTACETAGVPFQHFVTRTDLACGSTIGPVTAARLGIVTIDVGMPQLSMHSAREMAGAHDPGYFTAALQAFLRT